jgi:SAM-dependent methyltransferase
MTDGSSAARAYATHVEPSLLPVAATLLALAGVREGEVVVDVCCGSGLLTRPAAAAAGPRGRVYGVDADADALAVARARRMLSGSAAAAWARADAGALPFANGAVDKIVCGAVLHRATDVRPVLAEWARVLAPGGRVAACAWGSFRESEAEDAMLRALAEHGVDPTACERRVSLVCDGVPRAPELLPALLREAGLHVTHDAGSEVTVPFVGAAAFATWRLAFPRATAALGAVANGDAAALRASVAGRVAALLGPAPVLVHSGIHYATASPR